MTNQVNDIIAIRDKFHLISHVNGVESFMKGSGLWDPSPYKIGVGPLVPLSTACWRGHREIFNVIGGRLELHMLFLAASRTDLRNTHGGWARDGDYLEVHEYPAIDGVTPAGPYPRESTGSPRDLFPVSNGHVYAGLSIPVDFTGTLGLFSGAVIEFDAGELVHEIGDLPGGWALEKGHW